MGLVPNQLTNTKKSKKQKKRLTAEQREAEASFEKLNKKWDKLYGKLSSTKPRPAEIPKLRPPPGREPVILPSKVTPGGSTARRDTPAYSGDKVMGVALMHKSNYAPVFSDEEAKDISRMRRG